MSKLQFSRVAKIKYQSIWVSIDKGLQSLAIRKGTMDESIYVGKIFHLNEPPYTMYMCAMKKNSVE